MGSKLQGTSSEALAGTMITSFYYASTTTYGNWFQTNQPPEHELDDRGGDTVTSVCVTNEKDMALQWQIWSPSVTVLWCSKTKISDGTRILVLVRVLWDMISKVYWQFWHSFFKNALESSYNFNPIEITWRNLVRSVCLKPVSIAMWRLHTLWCFSVPAYSILYTTYSFPYKYYGHLRVERLNYPGQLSCQLTKLNPQSAGSNATRFSFFCIVCASWPCLLRHESTIYHTITR